MQDQGYPSMESICRLCLKENAGVVNIFTDPQIKLEKSSSSNMSIPMRIMSCTALEVQAYDDLPSKICTECRYLLEKCYLFRKQSQSSDAKLRKHIRLLSLGKKSKVFIKNTDDEDDDDEIEFMDSINFLKEYEEKLKEEEQLKFERFKEEQEAELIKSKEMMKTKCKQELRSEVEKYLRVALRKEMQKQFDEVMIPKIKAECLEEAKESLREEVKDECRHSEMKTLLDDLQYFLNEKQIARREVATKNNAIGNIMSSGTTETPHSCNYYNNREDEEIGSARKRPRFSAVNIKKVQLIQLNTKTKDPLSRNQTSKSKGRTNINKPELILSDSATDGDIHLNEDVDEDDGDSDNFLIFDTDEGFELQKKSEVSNENGEDEIAFLQESDIPSYDSSDEHMVVTTQKDSPKITATTTTTSYRIEDGEINFLNKSKQATHSHSKTNEEDNIDQLQNQNIMILNFPTELDDEEENLELVEYAEVYDNKATKKPVAVKGQKALKRYRSSEIKNTQQQFTTTTSTIETRTTTLLAKSSVNSVHRPTDTPKMFKCNDCPIVFSTNSSLERHLRTHRKIEATGSRFECPECHVVVSCASALRRHMFIHCDEKRFICTECGKAFVQREILKRHMQTHTGIKPHQCEHCDRSFAQRIDLKQHINRHHTDEPRLQQHCCHLCPKRFNHASGLSRHLVSHSGVDFQCSECDRTFGDRSSIKRHIANMHGSGKMLKSDKK